MIDPISISNLEVVLRIISATALSVAATYLIVALSRKTIRPSAIWTYVAVVTLISASWRWLIVAMTPPDFLPEYMQALIDPWLTQASQAIWTLVGVALTLVVFTSSRHRASDGV